MRKLIYILLPAFLLSCQSSKTKPAGESRDAKPNILIILADDAGYADFGFQGSDEIETPNLDKLAADGVIFTDAHVSSTVCSPSRAGLLTGRYQQRFGHEANSPPADLGMDTTEVTIADALGQNGYETAIFGKWHLGSADRYHPNNREFDHFYGLLSDSRNYFPKDYGKGNPKTMMLNREYTPMDEGYVTDPLGANFREGFATVLVTQDEWWQPNLYYRSGTFQKDYNGRRISFGIESWSSVSGSRDEAYLKIKIYNRQDDTLRLVLTPNQLSDKFRGSWRHGIG